MKSSWLKTIQLFVQTGWNQRKWICIRHPSDYEFHGKIYLAGFYCGNAIHVNTMLPPWLWLSIPTISIIDEIHQLVTRTINANKFIQSTGWETIDVYEAYRTFVLSVP